MKKRTTGIIILAAGSSSRLGQPKQFLEFNGKTLLFHTVEQALKVTDNVIVVSGAQPIEIEQQLNSVVNISNEDWESGMGSSLCKGLQEMLLLHPGLDRCIITVCDQPFINACIFQSLIEKQESSGKGIVASAYAATSGVPVLFNSGYFDDLLNLPDSGGAKMLIAKYQHDTADVRFEKGAIDIDTMEDYQKLTGTL
ncbi:MULTISPECIES: nucleotidyltransferase family protein [Chryseobacterium]|uniref:Molybdenum cofactor cytidylyltransferase n=1 Tax=Chryseobacterium camelliae TaxID=1265445 RepID=A0ABU0TFS4_9FLAO|nr:MULTISPECIES: nucleotidyltransferase family protein [Chryseobacterium]MDT3406293.1 molybdenum cofactor cytidylyltransferase [Pseudacidovorax intermedius]MDQ1095909.1 molybdenum cofactor cytidylyltransferase [Chryseobacterium camelliae]MDQ1099845.1 molybdenum cofactor cytidylyltransferase [Chryseobacterium sp. SORGH_AS_1048]MDR6087191.1 molybdenum cofactor cytidylyltransferase [Chryseobacterium sp. SORGH_AS_0909]MDR6131564.1 molybdenum cofactor cytidylyltransferase [Chryseobacterium sp. SORG